MTNTEAPDTSMECFPCGCISCPGFHECVLPRDPQIGDVHDCAVCSMHWDCLEPDNEWMEHLSDDVVAKMIPPRYQWAGKMPS